MDIHPPHGPVHSIREFFLHLSIVTIGILIALSLEGLLEWRHHRELAQEARSNITREIADNKKQIDDALASASRVEAGQTALLELINARLEHRSSGAQTLSVSYGVVDLRSSSWETAQATGAFSYMDYGEIKRYAEVYTAQRRLDTVQDQLLNSFIVGMPPEDVRRASDTELRGLKNGILRTLAYLHAAESIARQLSEQYGKVLVEKQ